MDAAFLPQTAMADRLKVTQQSVSNWLMGKRNPRAHVIPGLLKLAQDTGLDVRNYESNPNIDRITAYLQKNKGREFIRLLELYDRMGKVGKEKFLRCTEKMEK
jgi:transcriptional regulator with XRE-family HTH domain